MRIYIATSWKNEKLANTVASALRLDGHDVDCFCDPSSGRFIFHWRELFGCEEDRMKFDAVSFLNDDRVRRAFTEDRGWIDWSDAVVMIHPCGKSAHLEAGYAKGKGKKLFLWGAFPKGEFDVMYGFADAIFRDSEFNNLRIMLKGAY